MQSTQFQYNSSIENDLLAVEELLKKGVRSQVYLADSLAKRLVQLGGKRLRPLLMCLSYHTVASRQSQRSRCSPRQLHTLASVGEWVHTATLFHDDVLDQSTQRRGESCAHILEGNKVAILVGDYVYAEAFALLMEEGLLEPSKNLADTIKSLVEGELLQHRQTVQRDLALDTYERIAKAKTASLFAWCCETGAWAAGSNRHEEAKEFGLQLGFAFQMADDLLDTFELNTQIAKHEDLKEWTLSAPPLPIVSLAQSDLQTQSNWAELSHYVEDSSALKEKIHWLQTRASLEPNLLAMKAKVDLALDTAAKCLNDFGHSEFLGQALELIRSRAEEGFETAREFRSAHT
jgi:octaprenyl-diphosphate synthase